MIIKSKSQKGNFAQIPNEIFTNPVLSAKAKGILCYCLSKPTTWQVRMFDLKKHFRDGVDSLKSGMKELKKHGYAQLIRTRDKGKYFSCEYIIYESPELNSNCSSRNSSKEKTTSENTANGISTNGNTPISIKTEFSNTDFSNINNNKKEKEKENLSIYRMVEHTPKKEEVKEEIKEQEKINPIETMNKSPRQIIESNPAYQVLVNKYNSIDVKKVMKDWEKNIDKSKKQGNRIKSDETFLLTWFEKFLKKELEFKNIDRKKFGLKPLELNNDNHQEYQEAYDSLCNQFRCNFLLHDFALLMKNLIKQHGKKETEKALNKLHKIANQDLVINNITELKNILEEFKYDGVLEEGEEDVDLGF